MPAPKGNQNAKGSKGGTGRPTVYRVEHVQTVRHMAAMGWTEIKMASALSISVDTFRRWKLKYVDFLSASTPSPEEKLAAVQGSLFHRCVGYDHEAVKIITVSIGGGFSEVRKIPYVEHYPPDVAAIQFFLKNRDPSNWRDRQEVDQKTDVAVRIVGGLPDEEPGA